MPLQGRQERLWMPLQGRQERTAGAVAGKVGASVGWRDATVALALRNLDETGAFRSFSSHPAFRLPCPFQLPCPFLIYSHRHLRGVGHG